MNKQEMLDWRTQQDMRASRNESYQKRIAAHREIEDREMMKAIPMSDQDYFEQLWNEVA